MMEFESDGLMTIVKMYIVMTINCHETPSFSENNAINKISRNNSYIAGETN